MISMLESWVNLLAQLHFGNVPIAHKSFLYV